MKDLPVAPPEGKNARSLRRKVELLEAAIDVGKLEPPISDFKSMQDIAAWEDEALGITRWTSPNVTSRNGHYPDLASRLASALARIKLSRLRKVPGRRSIAQARRTEADLIKENKALAVQNDDLLRQLEDASEEQRRLQSRLMVAHRRLAEAGFRVD